MRQVHQALTDQQITILRMHVEDLLQSPLFRNSKRYPRFLRKIVECVITGDLDELKERSLGLSVFDRSPDYDTGADPIVRITAGEVRRRLAQFYQEHAQEQTVQIFLPLGSYVPELHFYSEDRTEQRKVDLLPDEPRSEPLALSHSPNGADAPSEKNSALSGGPSGVSRTRNVWGRSSLRIAALSSALTMLVIGAGYFSFQEYRESRDRALNRFWAPMMAGNDVAPFVIGRATLVVPGDSDPSLRAAFQGMKSKIAISDASAFSKICAIVRTDTRNCTMQISNQASILDMRRQPVILIGLLNNEWSVRLTGQLRFRLNSNIDADGITHEAWISDAKNRNAYWGIDFGQRLDAVTRDYGILARFNSDVTEQPVAIVGGLSALGTEGVGDFATDPRSTQLLESMVPPGKSFRNVEAVIETEVIEGKPGRARIVAADFW